jgi:hypothetical protein
MLGGKILVGAIMTCAAFLLFVNVVLRYVFGYGISWAEEVTRYTMLWTVFVGAGVIAREGTHVSMDAREAPKDRLFGNQYLLYRYDCGDILFRYRYRQDGD